MGDTPSSIKVTLQGNRHCFTARELWDSFSRAKVTEQLRNEVDYIKRKNDWNDLGFSRYEIRQLLRLPGAETKIYGVQKWVILLVLLRSRALAWYRLKSTRDNNVSVWYQREDRQPHVFTPKEIADIQNMAKEIQDLMQGGNPVGHPDESEELPSRYQLKEGEDFRVDRKVILTSSQKATVYGAWYPKDSAEMLAAFKEVRWDPGVSMDAIRAEIRYMLTVRHENVVRILGWAEFSANGIGLLMRRRDYNLRDVLYDPLSHISGSYLDKDPNIHISVALAIARGLEDLHRVEEDETGLKKPAILHRDLKPENILISGSFESIEVSDFGSFNVLPLQTPGRTQGVIPYRAPELNRNGAVYTSACDIWSYGLILAQILCRMELEYAMDVYDMAEKLMPYGIGGPVNWPVVRAAPLANIADRIKKVAEKCLRLEPLQRATAEDCANALSGME